MWFCQEEWQRAYPACEIECAAEILSEVGDQPGTSMLGVERCRGHLGQTWVLAWLARGSAVWHSRSLSESSWAGPQPTTGLYTALACPCLPRVTIVHHTAGSNMPAHMKMLLAGQS